MPSRWIPDPNQEVDPKLKPRFLTSSEIDSIVQSFPKVTAADNTSAIIAQENFKAEVKKQLMTIELVPHPDAIARLSESIKNHYLTSLMPRGIPVGVEASEAFGSVITQMTLDTFHQAGQASAVGHGLKGMRDLLYAVKNRKLNSTCTVHFKMPVNARDVYDAQVPLVEKSIADFVLEDDIYRVDLDNQSPDSPFVIGVEIWHKIWMAFTGKDFPNSMYAMRLKLNKKEMYKHRVTPQKLASLIEGGKQIVDVIHSDFETATLDIFPDENLVRSELANRGYTIDHMSKVFLTTVVKPSFGNIRVKGIEGIKAISPVEKGVMAVFNDAVRANDSDFNMYDLNSDAKLREVGLIQGPIDEKQRRDISHKIWKVQIDHNVLLADNISLDDAVKLVYSSGCRFVGFTTSILDPKQYEMLYIYTPSKDMNFKEHTFRWINDNQDNPLVKETATYTYAITTGSNLKGLHSIPWIDKSKTVCNNMHTLQQVIGAEASRQYVMYEIIEVMAKSGIQINPRHITLILDFMFNRGIPLGVTYSGISRQRDDFMGMATIERSMQFFRDAAPYDRHDPTLNIATSIVVGMPPCIGPNCYKLFPDEVAIQKTRERIQKKKAIKELIKNGYKLDAKLAETAANKVVSGLVTNKAEGEDILCGLDFGTDATQETATEPVTIVEPQDQQETVPLNPTHRTLVIPPQLREALGAMSNITPIRAAKVNVPAVEAPVVEDIPSIERPDLSFIDNLLPLSDTLPSPLREDLPPLTAVALDELEQQDIQLPSLDLDIASDITLHSGNYNLDTDFSI